MLGHIVHTSSRALQRGNLSADLCGLRVRLTGGLLRLPPGLASPCYMPWPATARCSTTSPYAAAPRARPIARRDERWFAAPAVVLGRRGRRNYEVATKRGRSGGTPGSRGSTSPAAQGHHEHAERSCGEATRLREGYPRHDMVRPNKHRQVADHRHRKGSQAVEGNFGAGADEPTSRRWRACLH